MVFLFVFLFLSLLIALFVMWWKIDELRADALYFQDRRDYWMAENARLKTDLRAEKQAVANLRVKNQNLAWREDELIECLATAIRARIVLENEVERLTPARDDHGRFVKPTPTK